MDGKTITSMRTGAVTGVSIRHLAKPDAHSVGLVGCGAQGYYQVLYACAARSIQHVSLYDVSSDAASDLKERLAEMLSEIEIQITDSTETLVSTSDIVITATTATRPVFRDDPALFEGRHFVAIGSFQPEVREYPDAVFSRVEKVWMDLHFAAEESGELLIPLHSGILRSEQLQTLGHLIMSEQEPERGRYGTTFFKTVGMALFDLVAAQEAYRSAVEGNLGTQL
jgi:ornithine cyclodeaminase/alanine dehydrogenase-like protein (mu-crystallin family)